MTLTIRMFKNVFLKAWLRIYVFRIIPFVVASSFARFFHRLTYLKHVWQVNNKLNAFHHNETDD